MLGIIFFIIGGLVLLYLLGASAVFIYVSFKTFRDIRRIRRQNRNL